ncbi:MAG: oligosaccharide flippase family protein [Myxococcota bacterium]
MTESPQAPNTEEVEAFKGRATSGAFWTAVGFGGRQLVRLGSNLILTRLLFEEYFGLMAIVSVVVTGIQLFADIGVSQAIIQSDRDDRGFTDTLWTIEIGRATLLWLVTLALAGPTARFYDEPILTSLISVASFSAVIEGFRSTNYFTENRKLHMRRLILLEVGSQLAGSVVMVIWALISPTIWSLVAGGLTAAFASTLWSWVGLPGRRNRFHFEREAALSLYHFGRWIVLSTLLMFTVRNGDRLVFGKLVTMAVLGVYNIAVNLAQIPSMALGSLSWSVIFPIYSRFKQNRAELPMVFRSVRLPVLIVGGWATAGLVAGGPTIIEILYDPRYIEAGWMLQVLAAGPWFGVVMDGTNGVALLALGHSRWMAMASGAKLIAMAALIPLGWHLGGFLGAMLGVAVSDVVRYLVSMAGVLRFGLDGRLQDLKLTSIVAISAFVGWLSVQGLIAIGWTNLFLHAVAVFIVVTLVWLPQHLVLWRRYKGTGHLFFAEGVGSG